MTVPVRVWLVPVDVPPAAAARCLSVLDGSERARAGAFLSPGDRQRFAISHGALRILAGRALGAPAAALSWIAGPDGKPELASSWPGLHTSLSHSADMIAAAVSAGRPVGVDIQHLVPGLDTVGLSARFFAAEEAAHVAAGHSARARADRFARLWARKEAAVKAAGGRLWPNLAIAVHSDVVSCAVPAGPLRVVDIAAPAGYRAAVALVGSAPFAVQVAAWPGAATAGTATAR